MYWKGAVIMITKKEIMNRIDELLDKADNDRLNELFGRKKEQKAANTVVVILAIIGAVVAIAGIAFALYTYFKPEYLDDFDEDFEDDFEDDFFEDEDEILNEDASEDDTEE